jgi:hypothetical protein
LPPLILGLLHLPARLVGTAFQIYPISTLKAECSKSFRVVANEWLFVYKQDFVVETKAPWKNINVCEAGVGVFLENTFRSQKAKTPTRNG